jgi:hypothetical protein
MKCLCLLPVLVLASAHIVFAHEVRPALAWI